jgi:zinc transporter ZupT
MGKTNAEGARWICIPVRVVAMTFLLTVLSFAVALLLSILGTVVYSQVKHVAPNLTFAYRHVAFPFAIAAGAIVLMVSIGMEVRSYRRGKVLERIEGASLAGRR